MFKTLRGNAPDYQRTSFSFTSDIHARLLRSPTSFQLYVCCIHQNLTWKYIEIHLYFPVHQFGIPFLHIFKTQRLSQYLSWINQSKFNDNCSAIVFHDMHNIWICGCSTMSSPYSYMHV